jgi:hypothetical protein
MNHRTRTSHKILKISIQMSIQMSIQISIQISIQTLTSKFKFVVVRFNAKEKQCNQQKKHNQSKKRARDLSHLSHHHRRSSHQKKRNSILFSLMKRNLFRITRKNLIRMFFLLHLVHVRSTFASRNMSNTIKSFVVQKMLMLTSFVCYIFTDFYHRSLT